MAGPGYGTGTGTIHLLNVRALDLTRSLGPDNSMDKDELIILVFLLVFVASTNTSKPKACDLLTSSCKDCAKCN